MKVSKTELRDRIWAEVGTTSVESERAATVALTYVAELMDEDATEWSKLADEAREGSIVAAARRMIGAQFRITANAFNPTVPRNYTVPEMIKDDPALAQRIKEEGEKS